MKSLAWIGWALTQVGWVNVPQLFDRQYDWFPFLPPEVHSACGLVAISGAVLLAFNAIYRWMPHRADN